MCSPGRWRNTPSPADFADNLTRLWALHQTAKAYGQRPAALLGIERNPLAAWQFDHAAAWLGRYVEAHQQEREKRGDQWKPKWTLPQILDGAPLRGRHGAISDLMLVSGRESLDI